MNAYTTNAGKLDALILASVCEFLCHRRKLLAALKTLGVVGDELDGLVTRGCNEADRLSNTPPGALKDLFAALVIAIQLGAEHVSITFRSLELRRFLIWQGTAKFHGRQADWSCSDARYELVIAARAISDERSPVLNLSARPDSPETTPNPALVQLIQKARKAMRLVEENREQSPDELAKVLRCRSAHFSRLVRLNYLAPDIVTAILDGTQPEALTADGLFKTNMPLDWGVQRQLFGFPAPTREVGSKLLFGRPRLGNRSYSA